MWLRAYEWICREIRDKRRALGYAEKKPNVPAEELQKLNDAIEILEWISTKVLAAKGEDDATD